MASRRNLKKNFHHLCDEMEQDCVFLLTKQCEAEGHARGLYLDKALQIRDDFGRRISHCEKGMKPKLFFRKWLEDLSNSVGELYQLMEAEYQRTGGTAPQEDKE